MFYFGYNELKVANDGDFIATNGNRRMVDSGLSNSLMKEIAGGKLLVHLRRCQFPLF